MAWAFQEAEAEIDGAAEYVGRLNGNETTRLLEDISELTERRLQSSGE